MTEGPVIIVGGRLNGLTVAVLLADLEVASVLVERHEDTSIQYKFAGISPRSMEVSRGVGLEHEIRAHETGDQQGGSIARGETGRAAPARDHDTALTLQRYRRLRGLDGGPHADEHRTSTRSGRSDPAVLPAGHDRGVE